ncbi:MAG: hypothetical protein H8E44_41685 [Planctomycetes bacterium]|nr:hypothetical protein [Planctomycetota bacterium]MBL7040488.1 hypothetical protein [Pirellulaceae bacterium]
MPNETAEFSRQSFKWVKAETGTTYLCPVDVIKGRSDLTDEELSVLCIDESLSPHND